MANIKFPSWHDADITLMRMSADLGAHIYIRCTDPDCHLILSEHTPAAMLIPYQWFDQVPDQCKPLFEILYNEFSDSVFYDINAKEIFEQFIGERTGIEIRTKMRDTLYEALKAYDDQLLKEWDGDLNKPRNLRDRFLMKMCCEMRPLTTDQSKISEFVKEDDKRWVV